MGEGLPNLANFQALTIRHGPDVRPAGQPRHRPHRRPPGRTTPAARSGTGCAALAVPLPPRVPGARRLDPGRFRAPASSGEGADAARALTPAVADRACAGL